MEKNELPGLITELLNLKENQQAEMRHKIYQSVLDSLMHNTAQLYQVLYKIDVSEAKVKNAFVDNPPAELAAERITMLIIERQIEKIQWRRKYSS